MTEKREKRLWIRLNKEEFEQLQKNAISQGCTMSELIRRTAIYGNKMSAVTLDMEPIRRMLFEMQKQGNNLNQLAHEANTYGMYQPLVQRINDELAKSKTTREELNKLLVDIREGRLVIR